MTINTNSKTYVPPFHVFVIDTIDAYYYADIFGEDWRYKEFTAVKSFPIAKALADALFTIHNYRWESLKEMNDVDGGYDVRVFDENLSCLYAAHKRFEEHWIGDSR